MSTQTTFTAWGITFKGEEIRMVATDRGPDDGYTLYQLPNGEYIAVPFGTSDAAYIANSDGMPEE